MDAEFRLERLTDESLPVVTAWLTDPRMAETGVWGPWSSASFADLTRRKDGMVLQLSLEAELVGIVTLSRLDLRSRNAELGIFLKPGCWGQGLGTRAMRAILEFVFLELGLYRVYGLTLATNERAIGLASKLGLRAEARIPEYVRFRGRWQDCLVFGLTREDFSKLRNTTEGKSPGL